MGGLGSQDSDDASLASRDRTSLYGSYGEVAVGVIIARAPRFNCSLNKATQRQKYSCGSKCHLYIPNLTPSIGVADIG
jgi:hypothetical protein